jgi:hypothetical protein
MTTEINLLSNISFQERIDLANNPTTPPETLTILARDENSDVRYWVAKNPNTPLDGRFYIQVTGDKNYIFNIDETQQKLEELELLKQQAQGKIFDL